MRRLWFAVGYFVAYVIFRRPKALTGPEMIERLHRLRNVGGL